MQNEPLVSVVIPFYSGRAWLIEAIKSVEKQKYSNLEIIVINDGSKEDISDVKEMYNSINVVHKTNGGPASARNLGIEKSAGKYIAFLDSDDIWLNDKLTKQIEEMENNQYAWSHHSYEMFWDNSTKCKIIDTHVHYGDVYKDCFISFKVQTSCVVVLRRILIEHSIRFPETKRYGQDTDFYKQIAKRYPIGYINGVHSRFRIRGTNAGFRARVQLNDKARAWNEIKDDTNVMKILPDSVIFAYKTSNVLYGVINFLNNRITDNEVVLEIFSKILYTLPYSLFKLNAKK